MLRIAFPTLKSGVVTICGGRSDGAGSEDHRSKESRGKKNGGGGVEILTRKENTLKNVT